MDEDGFERRRKSVTGKALSRGRFLALGGAGLAAATLPSTAARSAFAETATSVDIVPNDRSKAEQNRENLKNALGGHPTAPNRRLIEFPPGDYFVDNSAPQIAIGYFEGTLRMQPGARFVFTSTTHHGLDFYYGAGARFEGLSATYETLPAARNSYGANMSFRETSVTVVQNANIEGASAAGLYFFKCVSLPLSPTRVGKPGSRTPGPMGCTSPTARVPPSAACTPRTPGTTDWLFSAQTKYTRAASAATPTT